MLKQKKSLTRYWKKQKIIIKELNRLRSFENKAPHMSINI